MAVENWDQVRELFHRALDLPPGERRAFLGAECSDPIIRAEVETLLRAAETAASDSPTAEGLREAIQAVSTTASGRTEGRQASTAPLGLETGNAVIGRYRLLQKIGEGGMGEVWLAEQREPVHRRVALKVVKAGMNSREVIARFESERQALALMDHPAIAKVFDAGSTPEGTPYFVMEYIAGIPITAYCDKHRLGIHERLELFVHICEGVQHAHQKAIIHRDLKPSNILVLEVDGRATPKIIDFGVAKALTQKLIADTLFTRAGSIVGTPEYMSPEQALSSGEDIDTRTDVYSLGIIFYELLAGVPPLELRKIALDEFLRRLREEEPQKPSTKIRTQDRARSTELARKRQTEPLALAKQMRGDLDSIALKALEKDRSQRYGSPSDLAADVGRYLRNEAVLAVPPSAAYRARKFGRRYRTPLITAAAFVLVLAAAAVISIGQSIRANREAAVAQAVNDFLQQDLLAQASVAGQVGPGAKPDPDLKVRTALDRAAARITGKFDRQPKVEAAIRDTIGQTYLDLGLYAEARTQFQRALDLQRRTLGAKDPKTLKTVGRLARTADEQGRYAEAETMFDQTLQTQRRVLGAEHPDTLYSMSNLGLVYMAQGKYAQAEEMYRQVVEIQRRVLGSHHTDTLASMNNLANVYYWERKYAEAEDLNAKILEIRRVVNGPEHPYTQLTLGSLANIYLQEGKYAQAAALYGQALEIIRRTMGPEHPKTLLFMNNLSVIEYKQGNYAQAEALQRQIVEVQRRVLGPEHPQTLISVYNLANSDAADGKYAEAAALFRQVLEGERRVLGPEHPNTLETLSDFAYMYQRQGNYALAASYAAQDLTGLRRTKSPNVYIMDTLADIALADVSQGKYAEGEPLARQAVEFDRKNQPDDWQSFRAESVLGASLAGQKKYAEAEPLLLEGYQGMAARKARIGVPDWYHLDRAREWIVRLYQVWGKPDKAAEWRKK